MPIFEYHCQSCGHQFETLAKAVDKAPACPKCEGAKVERGLSVFAASVLNKSADACPSAHACPSAGGAGCRPGGCPGARAMGF